MTGPDLVMEFFFKDNDKYSGSVMRRNVNYMH
jgi:hypothetical protein